VAAITAEGRGAHVVLHVHSEPQLLGETGPQGELRVVERHVDGVSDGAALRVDDSRNAEADRVDIGNGYCGATRHGQGRLHGRCDDSFGARRCRDRDRCLDITLPVDHRSLGRRAADIDSDAEVR
jgi:hypothetical protein